MQGTICLSVWMCGLKLWMPEQRTALSACNQCPRVVCSSVCLAQCTVTLKQGEVLPSEGSSHVSSLACQRTLSLGLCPFYKVYFICSKFNCLKNSYRGMDFPKLNRELALFGIVRLFWHGSKDTQGWAEYSSQAGNEMKSEHTVVFCHPFCLLLLVALLCIPLFWCNAC